MSAIAERTRAAIRGLESFSHEERQAKLDAMPNQTLAKQLSDEMDTIQALVATFLIYREHEVDLEVWSYIGTALDSQADGADAEAA